VIIYIGEAIEEKLKINKLKMYSDVRQIEMHTTEPLVPGPSHLEVEISIAKQKIYISRQ
jgi:hypothetical protein